ncbi:MAG: hypothetical protein R3C17_16095 [Planctomycetaceae bacterium]
MDQSDPLDNYAQIREELRLYDAELARASGDHLCHQSGTPDAATCRTPAGSHGKSLADLRCHGKGFAEVKTADYPAVSCAGICHCAGTCRCAGSRKSSNGPGSMMKVLLANPRGSCAGVNMAIECLDEAIRRVGAGIYVYHEIVHNRYVVDRFTRQGVRFVNSLDKFPSASCSSARPWRIPRDSQHRATNCKPWTQPVPWSQSASRAIRYANQGFNILLIGHEELMKSLGQWVKRRKASHWWLPKMSSGCRFLEHRQAGLSGQTTLSVDERQLSPYLRNRYPHIQSPRKEASAATTNRQDAVKALGFESADVLIVLEVRTVRTVVALMEIGGSRGVPSYR